MRGKVGERSVSPLMGRITPAYAGKRLAGNCRKILFEDHPRLCGEKQKIFPSSLGDRGSPPPMRGKGRTAAAHFGSDRITPAYAGKSLSVRCSGKSWRDHPRLCGEKSRNGTPKVKYWGSPPPMRGKGPASAKWARASGITPAYAGKSQNMGRFVYF